MTFDKKEFASTLRAERARLGISQKELADKSGLNLATISQYENGEFVPGSDKVVALAEALGVTPNILMCWK